MGDGDGETLGELEGFLDGELTIERSFFTETQMNNYLVGEIVGETVGC